MIKSLIAALGFLTSSVATTHSFAQGQNEKIQFSQTTELEEEDLTIDTYEPGDSLLGNIYAINTRTSENGDFIIDFTVNKEELEKKFDEFVSGSGLLTGNTLYEKWTQSNNLFMDFSSWANNVELTYKSRKDEWLFSNLSAAVVGAEQYWHSDKTKVSLMLSPKLGELIVSPKISLSDISFVKDNDKRFEWGLVISDSEQKRYTLYDLLKDPETEEDDKTFNKAYDDLVSEMRYFEENDLLPNSNSLNILFANQNSEELGYKRGVNIKVDVVGETKPIPFNPAWLLVLSLLIVGPFTYYGIRKIFKI